LLDKKIDEKKLYGLLTRLFKNPEEVLKQVKAKKDLGGIKAELIRKYARREKLTKRIFRLIKYSYKIFFPAPYVAIVGTDGSGKTTTVENLAAKLKQNKYKVVYFYGGRAKDQIIPVGKIVNFFRHGRRKIKKDKEESKLTPIVVYKSKTIKIVTPMIYYIEYWLRYLSQIFFLRIKYDIILTDRSFIDIFASPNTNKFICKALFKLIPNPKHVLIWIEPKIAEKRSGGHPSEDLERQLKEYFKLKDKYIFVIKTDKGKEAVVDEIFNKVVGL
jgi:thymidylate kinase